MASGNLREALIFFSIATSIGCIVYFKPEPSDIGLWVVNALLALAAAALIAHVIGSYWKRWVPNSTTTVTVPEATTLSEDELRQRVAKAREEKQKECQEKATEYYENVTRPKEEAKLKEKLEKFYKQTGETWKISPGEILGWDDAAHGHEGECPHPVEGSSPPAEGSRPPDGSPRRPAKGPRSYFKGSSREAADTRKLPDHVMNPPPTPPQPKKKEKRKVVMPEEPSEGTPESITVILRTVQGVHHKRRFWKSQTIQDLLDFMTLMGYSQSVYQVCTSYPRVCISTDVTKSFKDLGIANDVLNVEHKDK